MAHGPRLFSAIGRGSGGGRVGERVGKHEALGTSERGKPAAKSDGAGTAIVPERYLGAESWPACASAPAQRKPRDGPGRYRMGTSLALLGSPPRRPNHVFDAQMTRRSGSPGLPSYDSGNLRKRASRVLTNSERQCVYLRLTNSECEVCT